MTILTFTQKVRICLLICSPYWSSLFMSTHFRIMLLISLERRLSFYWYSHYLSSQEGRSHSFWCFSSSRITSDDYRSRMMLTSLCKSDYKEGRVWVDVYFIKYYSNRNGRITVFIGFILSDLAITRYLVVSLPVFCVDLRGVLSQIVTVYLTIFYPRFL